jgi:hypothetical protein
MSDRFDKWIEERAEDDSKDKAFGKRLIDLLSLNVREDGRVVTSWGSKTEMGLGATVRRIMGEVDGVLR